MSNRLRKLLGANKQAEKNEKITWNQSFVKEELISNLSAAQTNLDVSKQEHQDFLGQTRIIRSRLNKLRYEKIGELNRKRGKNYNSESDRLSQIISEQQVLRDQLNLLNTEKSKLRNQTIPQAKRDLAIALEATKENVHYVSKEEVAPLFDSDQSLPLHEKQTITIKNLNKILKARSYDNVFGYIEYQDHKFAEEDCHPREETLHLIIDTSKSNTPGSIVKYLGENHHQFERLVSVPISSITGHYGTKQVNSNPKLFSSINNIYELYNSPKNQFYIDRYQKASNYGLKQITSGRLSQAKRLELIRQGQIKGKEREYMPPSITSTPIGLAKYKFF